MTKRSLVPTFLPPFRSRGSFEGLLSELVHYHGLDLCAMVTCTKRTRHWGELMGDVSASFAGPWISCTCVLAATGSSRVTGMSPHAFLLITCFTWENPTMHCDRLSLGENFDRIVEKQKTKKKKKKTPRKRPRRQSKHRFFFLFFFCFFFLDQFYFCLFLFFWWTPAALGINSKKDGGVSCKQNRKRVNRDLKFQPSKLDFTWNFFLYTLFFFFFFSDPEHLGTHASPGDAISTSSPECAKNAIPQNGSLSLVRIDWIQHWWEFIGLTIRK